MPDFFNTWYRFNKYSEKNPLKAVISGNYTNAFKNSNSLLKLAIHCNIFECSIRVVLTALFNFRSSVFNLCYNQAKIRFCTIVQHR